MPPMPKCVAPMFLNKAPHNTKSPNNAEKAKNAAPMIIVKNIALPRILQLPPKTQEIIVDTIFFARKNESSLVHVFHLRIFLHEIFDIRRRTLCGRRIPKERCS